MLVDDDLLCVAGLKVGITYEKGDLIVFVEACPKLVCKFVDGVGNGNSLRLSLEGGDHGIAVTHVGVEEVTETCGSGIFPEESCASSTLGISRLEN